MNPQVAKLAGQAVQQSLPFMKKLAASPKSEQPLQQMKAMMQMVEPAAAQPAPWERFIQMVKGFKGGPNVDVDPMRPMGRAGDPSAPFSSVKFNLRPKGGGSEWHGGFKPDNRNPFEMYVEHLTSDASRRKSIGDELGGLETYRADISSPAQKDWGWGKPKPSRQPNREARSPEDRVSMDEFKYMKERGYHQPGPSPQEKQQLVDRLLAMARQSGFKGMSFSAEPGERPRLYSRLMGYDFKPTNESELYIVSRMLTDFPGGGRQATRRMSDQSVAPQVRRLLGRESETMDASTVENVLGLSLDEGIDFGFVRPSGTGYTFTDNGRRAAQNWLQGMGQ